MIEQTLKALNEANQYLTEEIKNTVAAEETTPLRQREQDKRVEDLSECRNQLQLLITKVLAIKKRNR